MVLPAKIFEIKEVINFGLMTQKLKDFREEENYQENNEKKHNSSNRNSRPQINIELNIWNIQPRFYAKTLLQT